MCLSQVDKLNTLHNCISNINENKMNLCHMTYIEIKICFLGKKRKLYCLQLIAIIIHLDI
jgi:hypothetical protein